MVIIAGIPFHAKDGGQLSTLWGPLDLHNEINGGADGTVRYSFNNLPYQIFYSIQGIHGAVCMDRTHSAWMSSVPPLHHVVSLAPTYLPINDTIWAETERVPRQI